MKRTNSFEASPTLQGFPATFDKGLNTAKSGSFSIRNPNLIYQGTHNIRDQINLQVNETFNDGRSEGSSFYRRKEKIPEALKNSIMEKTCERRKTVKSSKLTFLKKIVLKEKFTCGICQCEYKLQEKNRISKCVHEYCDSCLQHYVIYKVNMFEEVICPDENCDQLLDMESKFYQNLPKDIQEKYKKLHTFYETSKNPNMRLCPNENCDGVLRMIEGISPKCQTCGKEFCQKCLFPIHSGQCNQNQVDFFQQNLHYRQCKKCRNVIEKNQGCNHMTCRCGHQFCYICGKDWLNNGHICDESQPQQNNQNNPLPDNHLYQCFDDCLCGVCFKFLLKVIIFIPMFLCIFSILLIKYAVVVSTFTLVVIFVGTTGFTCDLICEQDNCCCSLLMILFLPITMLVGIGMAFKELFAEVICSLLEEDCESFGECIQSFCQD